MLTRAVRRHNRRQLRQYLLHEYSQLKLPWLCPALDSQPPLRRHVSTASAASHTIRPRSTSNAQHRKLATAIDTHASDSIHGTIPFDGLPPFFPSQPPAPPRDASHHPYTSPRPFNTSDIVVLPHNESSSTVAFRSRRKTAIPSELEELLQNLYACVQVGRLDRAAELIRLMADTFERDAPQLIDAHQKYLSGCLDLLSKSPAHRVQEMFTTMQKWLEVDIRAKGVPIDHGIVAIMLKASFAALVGTRLHRTLRRYVKLAQDCGRETFFSTITSSILTSRESNQILELLPQEFDPPSEELSESDIQEAEQARMAVSNEPGAIQPRRFAEHPFEPLPELKPVEIKGLGLDTLRRSLGSLDADFLDDKHHVGDIKAAIARQEQLERDVLDAALERWRKESDEAQEYRIKGSLQHPPLGAQVFEWVKQMSAELESELKRAETLEVKSFRDGYDYDIAIAAPFLKLLPPEKVCVSAIMQFFTTLTSPRLRRNGRAAIRVRWYCDAMGSNLFREAQIEKIQTHNLQNLSNLSSAGRRKRVAKLIKNKKWSPKVIDTQYAKVVSPSDPSPLKSNTNTSLVAKIGAVLLSLFMKTAKVHVTSVDPATGQSTSKLEPVATHNYDWRLGRKVGVLDVSTDLIVQLQREPVSSFIAKHLPMIVPPRPWKGLNDGAYYRTEASVVRLRDVSYSQKSYLQLADQNGDLSQLYAGLDVVSKTPWRVNKDVLRVMMEIWNSGKALGKIVPQSVDVELPPRPDTDDPTVLGHWKRITKRMRDEAQALHSQRCYLNFQLEVARAFSNTTFYCPQNCDFRGRAYPITPYFNHTGADHVRSLFNFAEGKELGDRGLFWLKVQLANVFGQDKESLADRVSFVDEHLPQIFDSASNPLNGDGWWQKAGDPWQCLAACMELKKALDSPVPTKYVSHLPVQQDGSCNGLQHYAALGGDEIGARQVNLAPGDKPADVYSGVAQLVRAMVHADAEAGHPMAKELDGKITRKMVKQPVMTNVYGVTYIGATRQVERQLREVMPEIKNSVDAKFSTYQLSAYVAKCIFKALKEMFNGAQAIQAWLGECGARISSAITPEQIDRVRTDLTELSSGTATRPTSKFRLKRKTSEVRGDADKPSAFKSTIVWTTPLGLPVVQPYRTERLKNIRTHLQSIALHLPSGNEPVNKRKQLQSFPPNFIHSLDAAHMMLSALKCDDIGLAFGSVHDSFWTHAGDVPTLNRILRDAFVSMHKEDIIKRLKEEFEARYRGCYQWMSIQQRSPLGAKLVQYYAKVKKRPSSKISSASKPALPDLLEEYDRQALLRSEDPAEVAKGRQMVTPLSILEEEGATDEDLYSTRTWGRRTAQEPEVKGFPDDDDMAFRPPEPTVDQEEGEEAGEDEAEEDEAEEDEAGEPESSEVDAEEAVFDPEEDIPAESPTHPDVDAAWHTHVEGASEAPKEEAQMQGKHGGPKKKTKQGGPKKEGARKRKRLQYRLVYFWMPLKFPEPPPRGVFDVTQLKDSLYFFS